MEAIKTTFEKIPDSIKVPSKLVNKKGKVIFLVEESNNSVKSLVEFYGMMADLPERDQPETYDSREIL